MVQGAPARHEAPNHEIKFVVAPSRAPTVLAWIALRCRLDPHPVGIVSSIYYDTPDWTLLREATNGDFLKTKVRLRWYAAPGGEAEGTSFLEVKRKIGGKREKVRIETGFSGRSLERMRLHDVSLLRALPLLGEERPSAGPLVPIMRIAYRRRRFVEPSTGARVNLDDRIRVPAVNFQRLGRSVPEPMPVAVLEIKSDRAELPEILQAVTAFGCRKSSFSKYHRACSRVIVPEVS